MIFWSFVVVAGGLSFLMSLSLGVAGKIAPAFGTAMVTCITVLTAISVRRRERRGAITPEQKTSIIKALPFLLLLLLFYATALFLWRDRVTYKRYVEKSFHRELK